MATRDSEKIRGELLSFRVLGADFWGCGTLRTQQNGGEVTIAGKVLGANVGDTLELEGTFTQHAKYGRQFKITLCTTVLPSDSSGVIGWLAAKLPQVSRRRAEELVERFGVDGLWARLDAGDLNALCTVDGITGKRAQEIVDAYRQHKGERDRMVQFKQWGLTDNQVARVLKEWGEDAEDEIKRNPYSLMECVNGFGWERADQVALRMGLRRDAPPRLAAGLLHVMREARAQGHCFCSQGKLVAIATEKICAISDENAVRRALDGLLERNKLERLEAKIYLPEIAAAEGRLAKVFATRAQAARRAA